MATILLDIHRFCGVFDEGAEEQQATSDAFLKHPALGGMGHCATHPKHRPVLLYYPII